MFNIGNILSQFSNINFRFIDVVDILIVVVIIYNILNFVHRTRAEQLIKGFGILLIVFLVSNFLNMYATGFILGGVIQFGIIAVILIFQPEIRSGLEYIGRNKIRGVITDTEKEDAKRTVNIITDAIDYFSSNRIGSIIVIQNSTNLLDFAQTGTIINGEISLDFLKSIFYDKGPLHDGAVIIKKNRILATGAFLPLSKAGKLPKSIGTRHRAALGLSEVSDATIFVVSEETGIISIAENKDLDMYRDIKDVEKKLLSIYLTGFKKRSAFTVFKEKTFNIFEPEEDLSIDKDEGKEKEDEGAESSEKLKEENKTKKE